MYNLCRICHEVFPTLKIYENHFKTAHPKEKCYLCFECGEGFSTRTYRLAHFRTEHPRGFHCPSCEMVMDPMFYFDVHWYECTVYMMRYATPLPPTPSGECCHPSIRQGHPWFQHIEGVLDMYCRHLPPLSNSDTLNQHG